LNSVFQPVEVGVEHEQFIALGQHCPCYRCIKKLNLLPFGF
jgi:hypothetical protein